MAARSGMANLITRLRADCEAGTADYSVAGETYFTDAHLQERLDQYRRDVKREPLEWASEYVAEGTLGYYDYYYHSGRMVEEAESGSLAWQVEDGNGSAIGTANYTANYETGQIRFDSDQGGSARYLSYSYFDYNRTAATIWRQKAANVANRFDVKTDNHDLKRSQMRMAFLQMAAVFDKQAKARTVTMVRGDVNVHANRR